MNVDSLPNEILSTIFDHALGTSETAVVLSQVSLLWRNVTFSMPWLWTDITISGTKELDTQLCRTKMFLERSKKYSFDFSLHHDDSLVKQRRCYSALFSLLSYHISRVRTLRIITSNQTMSQISRILGNITAAPRLETLELHITNPAAIVRFNLTDTPQLRCLKLRATQVNSPATASLEFLHLCATPAVQLLAVDASVQSLEHLVLDSSLPPYIGPTHSHIYANLTSLCISQQCDHLRIRMLCSCIFSSVKYLKRLAFSTLSHSCWVAVVQYLQEGKHLPSIMSLKLSSLRGLQVTEGFYKTFEGLEELVLRDVAVDDMLLPLYTTDGNPKLTSISIDTAYNSAGALICARASLGILLTVFEVIQ